MKSLLLFLINIVVAQNQYCRLCSDGGNNKSIRSYKGLNTPGMYNALTTRNNVAQKSLINNERELRMQTDGNLVLYDKETAVWSTVTYGNPGKVFDFVMQPDGNAVLYADEKNAIWATNTDKVGTGPYCFSLQSDRNLVLYDSNCHVSWTSNTNTGKPRPTLPKPVQVLFPKVTFETVIAFIPEKNTRPAISADQAATLTKSMFSKSGYGLSSRYNEYSSGAIKMKGMGSDPDITFKYFDKGVDSCNRHDIYTAVNKAISPLNPNRLIIVQNTNKPTCPGLADNSGLLTMVWYVNALNPHVLFHELGHGLSFPHQYAVECYDKEGKKVLMSDNCVSVDGERFDNMGLIPHDQPWFHGDFTNTESNAKGIMEHSAYHRLSATYPMLKESNVLDIITSGVYKISNTETNGDNTAVIRIPLNPPMIIKNDPISTGITYHTHYYIEFTQRRPNTEAGGVQNYVVVRTSPDHRSKRSFLTRQVSFHSTDSTLQFHDGLRDIRFNILNIDDSGATLDISIPSSYTPSDKVNNCYFSSILEQNQVVSVNDIHICRAITSNTLVSGTFINDQCVMAYAGMVSRVGLPDVEFLHCTSPPQWISLSSSVMENSFDLWGSGDRYVCRITFEGTEYIGRGSINECCFVYNNAERCMHNDASTKYLKWLGI